VLEKEIVRNPEDTSGGFGMYIAKVQTTFFLDRFSMVVELRRVN